MISLTTLLINAPNHQPDCPIVMNPQSNVLYLPHIVDSNISHFLTHHSYTSTNNFLITCLNTHKKTPQRSLSIVMYLLGISSYKVAETNDLASVSEANLDTIKQTNPQLVTNH